MTDPVPTRSSRPSLSRSFAEAFGGAYPLCKDVPNAMAALLQSLALREQALPEPVSSDARR